MLTAKGLIKFQKHCTAKRVRRQQREIENKLLEVAETTSGCSRLFHVVKNLQQEDLDYLIEWIKDFGYSVKIINGVVKKESELSAMLLIEWEREN